MKSKNKVLTCIYVVLLLAFVCYLFLANSIILSFNEGVGSVERISFSSIKSNQSPRVAIDALDYLGGTTEDFYIAGWGFCETDYDNTDKKISIVFKKSNSDTAYIFDNPANSRPDVYNAFKDTTRIKSEKADYRCSFSTLKMQPGLYELYISVVENEHDFGIVSVNRFFKKTADGMFEVNEDGSPLEVENTTIEKTDITLANTNPTGRGYIDRLDYDNDMLIVSGWATLSKDTNKTQKVFIGLTYSDGHTDYYNTIRVERSDLIDGFGDATYSYCGYNTTIPIGTIEGNVTISIVIGVEDKYYPIITYGQNEIKQTVVHDNIQIHNETPVGQGYIDIAEHKDDTLNVQGWATFSEETNSSQVVLIQMKSNGDKISYYLAETVDRPDLVTNFGNDSYSNCGFSVSIPIVDLTGEVELGLIVFADSKYYLIDSTGKKSVKLNAPLSTVVDANSVVYADETKGQGHIDVTKPEGDNLVISGWATYSEETNIIQTVIVSVTDETEITKYYSTTVNNRPDLISAFGSDTYSNCGFNATIPIADIKGNVEIDIVINIDANYYEVVTHGVTSVQIG